MIEEFIDYIEMERRMSPHSVKAYNNDVSTFLEFCQISSMLEIKEVSYQVVRSWIVFLVEQGISNKSVNRKITSLRTFFKWGLMNGYVLSNPMDKIKGLKQEKRIPEFIKDEALDFQQKVEIFPQGILGERDRLMIEVFYQTGIRLSELIHLKKEDVSAATIKVLGKRNKERMIPLSKALFENIQNFMENSSDFNQTHLLFFTDKGKQLYPKFVYRKVKHYLSIITSLKKKSPHILRHTFATHMLNNGAGLEILKDILGHADLNATQIYTHNSFEQINKEYKRAHPRGGTKK